MKIVKPTDLQDFRRTLSQVDPVYFDRVSAIVEAVRAQGDQAVLRYTRELDQVRDPDFSLWVTEQEYDQAAEQVKTGYQDVYEHFLSAAENIREFHRHQIQQSWEYSREGAVFGQKISPIQKAGVYVPGGLGFYPSSLIMNLVPAVVAGVPDITLASPPDEQGRIHPLLLTLARELGAARVLKAGGAQAVAALAYGTETVDRVYKITGPGNIYVALAKRLVMGVVGIDSIAGPSEVAILSDGSVPPEWVAMDLCAQAEHSLGTAVFLISLKAGEIEKVLQALEQMLPTLPRAELIRQCLSEDSFAVTVSDSNEAFDIINRIAPEHLEILAPLPRETVLSRVSHSGAVFLGGLCPVPLGDYFAGPNHVLPTNGTAVYSSPLGVYDFIHRTSYLEVNQTYIDRHSDTVAAMARFEDLEAHARSLEMRRTP